MSCWRITDLAFRADAVDLKHRLRDIETKGDDRLHACLLQFVATSSATTSVALARRVEEPSTASGAVIPATGLGSDVACLHYSSEAGAVALRGLYGGLEIF